MPDEELLARVVIDPKICAGKPYIRGTRICIVVVLDALTQGLSPEEVIEHYPALELDDVRAAVAYAWWMAENNGGFAWFGPPHPTDPFRPL